MCRASDSFFPNYSNAYPQSLRFASVYVRFPGHRGLRFPESLTLVYLPRISEAELEIDGMKVRPDLPAFVTLHRVRDDDGVSYGCRDKVRAGAGLRFEVYFGEEKILKGTFRKEGKGWKVECRCMMERESAVREGDVVEVLVGVERGGGGGGGIRETVRMVMRRRRRGEGNCFRNGLEEIPEDGEAEGDGYDDTSSGEQCSCCGGSDGCEEEEGDEEEEEEEYEGGEDWGEVNTEGVKWAVDVGIWVLCLGVGLLVSRASSKKLRRRRRLI